MITAQTDEALLEAEILLATITELREHLAAGAVDAALRDELATDLQAGAAALATFAHAVAA